MPPNVSVVIPVRDEARSIGTLLESLCAQTHRPDEVVVCDAGSTDGTAEIVEAYARRGLPVRVLRIGEALPGRARNTGIREARHDLVALTDAGIWLDPRWLERLLAPFASAAPPDVVYGRFEPVTASFRQRVIALSFVPPRDPRTGLRTPFVASMAMRRRVWEAVGGFREDLRSAEDLLFIRGIADLKLLVRYEPAALAHWNPPATYTEAFRRFAAYSCWNLRAGLAKEWQIPLLRIYVLAAALEFTAFWMPLGALAPVIMLGVRAVKRVARERGIPGLLNAPAVAGTVLALAVIDSATFAGWWKWLMSDGATAGSSVGARR